MYKYLFSYFSLVKKRTSLRASGVVAPREMPSNPDSAQGVVNGGMRVLSAHSGADFESGAVHRRRGVNDEDMTNLRDGEADGGVG